MERSRIFFVGGFRLAVVAVAAFSVGIRGDTFGGFEYLNKVGSAVVTHLACYICHSGTGGEQLFGLRDPQLGKHGLEAVAGRFPDDGATCWTEMS